MQSARRQFAPTEVISFGLAVGSGLGLTGWIWDDLEHMRLVEIGVAWAHLLMTIGLFVALAGLVVVLSRSAGRPLTYLGFGVGFALAFVHPLAGRALWLILPLAGVWLALRSGNRQFALACLGPAVVLVGGIVDIFWHQANPGAVEANMLLLPGHAIELAGWTLGLVGSLIAWARSGQTATA
ncbi:MAG: hypothetical protein C4315_02430 [Chloroflexota bacterium]